MKRFTTEKLIRFHHCDPAGIVYYPRFFVLLHEAQEDFLSHIGHPEANMIRSGFGVPIVDLSTQFLAMSRHGDTVQIDLSLSKLGRSSIGMRYHLRAGDESRLRAQSTVVYVNTALSKPAPIPPDLHAALAEYVEEAA
jgi:4-hydroxybenzoyl-CoA thioesterase